MMPRLTSQAGTRRLGFTLTEMLAVLFILAILLAMVVGISRYIFSKSAEEQTRTTQAIAKDAIMTYRDKMGNFPGSLGELKNVPAAKEKMMKLPQSAWDGVNLKDGWGAAMTYQASGDLGVPVIISPATGSHDEIRSDRQ